MGGWLRHRPGGVGLRSERPGITGAMGPSMSWDPWPRPVARAAVVTQECTQIGENGLSAPFWGICVHCCAVGLGCGWPWDRNSVHKWEDRASPRRFGAFVYTVATRVAIRIATRAACVRWHERLSRHGVPAAPPRWPLSLGREDRLCASGAAARLASSPRRQPTRTPEEPP